MKLHLLSVSVAAHAALSSALRVPIKVSSVMKRGGSPVTVSRPSANQHVGNVLAAGSSNDPDSSLTLNDVHDLIYMANITIGGQSYPVQLDTGSSDLWIKGPSSPLPGATPSSQGYNLTYGIGWANGTISYAPVEFAGISVKSQAFLDVSSAQNPALAYGADGILGLGFTALSTIDSLVNNTKATTGRSLLFNLFQDNPSEPNFIAISLQRGEGTETVEGTFSVGQYEDNYKEVANSPAISTFPVNSPDRWNVLLEALLIGNKTVPVASTVQGAPGNRAVALLDSGTSFSYAPKEICDAIYSGVPGATFDATLAQWIIPCGTEIDLALQFNGQAYPMHPLDVTPASITDPKTCVGSFIPQTVSVGAGEFDWLVGDNFLRSVYSVYDFGDFDSNQKMGNPYIKLLSLIDPNQASVDFHKVRGGDPNGNVTYNAANGAAAGSTTTVTLASDVAETLDKIGKYFPAMLGVMALNALILVLLLIVGIIFMCKKRGGRGGAGMRTPRTRRGLSPMPMNRTSMASFVPPAPHSPGHTYEPVSMAMTEDTLFMPPQAAFARNRPESNLGKDQRPNSTFTPPAAPFHTYDGDTLRGGDRPKSMAI